MGIREGVAPLFTVTYSFPGQNGVAGKPSGATPNDHLIPLQMRSNIHPETALAVEGWVAFFQSTSPANEMS